MNNRAPTTVSVPPLRSQRGSGVRKRKYRRHKKKKARRGRKQKTNVRGRGIGISRIIRSLLQV